MSAQISGRDSLIVLARRISSLEFMALPFLGQAEQVRRLRHAYNRDGDNRAAECLSSLVKEPESRAQSTMGNDGNPD